MTEITREALLARRAALANEEKVAWANLNAVLGAMQDCDLWLAHLERPSADDVARALDSGALWRLSSPDSPEAPG